MMNKLSQACELSLNDWLATFPDEIPEAECSAKHEKWKKNLFNKMRDDYYHKFTTNTIKIILIAAILCALLMTAFVFPSSRETTVNDSNTYSRYKMTEDNENSVNRKIKVGYIPDGYELVKSVDFGKQIIYTYSNNKNVFFTIWKCTSSIEMYFNTEFSETKEVVFDNVKYTYCQGDKDINNLIWTKNDYVYRLSGTFNLNDMVKIAKYVK